MPSWANSTDEAKAKEANVFPLDAHNVTLLDHVFPLGYPNPQKPDDFVYDLIAVGAGAAGLVSAKQTARRGGKSALVEKHLAGGDCLNVGCVPSKALLRCARSIAERRRDDLGAPSDTTAIDFGKVMERMRTLRAKIADVDSLETTMKAGADAYIGKGVFVGPHELQVGDKRLKFKKAVICTGGRATVPPIPGLRESSYLTHVTLFNLTQLPKRFCVIGAGPIGLEMAQSFQRFGSEVTLLEATSRILGPEDPDASLIVQKSLEADGVRVITDAGIEKVEDVDGGREIRITCMPGKDKERIEVVCDKLLVAAGRAANVENLGLEAAGVEFTIGRGIKTNDDLSTSNPDIFAAGDCTDNPACRFTHTSGSMATIAVTNALFGGRGPPTMAPSTDISKMIVPRCTFTEPEVASCGIANLAQAERAGVEVDTYTSSLEHNDRCILEGDTHGGFVKILCRKDTDQIVGGVIVAERAGEMLAEITLAAQHGLGIAALGHTVHPYPTAGEGVQQCALGYVRKHWERL
jgi:pyruvate/2-oxoglutarate dehydrogenase complex dihydrolipoamide dehydrogenase (E3) component